MKGYAQDLDTVNLGIEKNVGGKLEGRLIDAKVKTILYSAFYTISLSPNQVIDLLLVREGFFDAQDYSDLPFLFHLDSEIYRDENPFEKQLLSFLRREGDNAFLFSSIPNGKERAKEWGEFIKENRGINDADLIEEANDDKMYGEIVEWVKKLDLNYPKINIVPFYKVQYEKLFVDYITNLQIPDFIGYTLPKSRSQAYQLTSYDHKRELIDLISNIQYAIGTNSKLILGYPSPFNFEDYKNYMSGNVSIDMNGLLEKYPYVETAIMESDLKDISVAMNKSRLEVETAWKLIDDKDIALKHFKKGLDIFLSNIVGEIARNFSLDLNFKVIRTHIDVPYKKKFKGIDKFINLK